MSQLQIFTPILPYVGQLPGELRYGSRIKLRGHFREPHNTVHIILQKEALLNPQDDLPLHITIHPGRKEIVRNHLCSDCSTGGQEERVDNCPIECGQDFELTIVPSSGGFGILLHGTAVHTFSYRTPLAAARYLFVSSGCVIFAINFENWNSTASEQPQLPTAPPLRAPPLYPVLDRQPQQRAQANQQAHHHHQHSNNNLRELVLQVLPLVQLAASQLQANANSAPAARRNDGNALAVGNLAHLLPLFQPPAKGRKERPQARRRPNRWAFLRLPNAEIVPAMFLACSMGLMRLFRFVTIACVFGYVGYVFSRNVGISWK
uniref:Galectin n=1 Tax=Anopheles dirus TaxID=7168 RepID=A0A182NT26_9DIPT